jgi:hypothetical protein
MTTNDQQCEASRVLVGVTADLLEQTLGPLAQGTNIQCGELVYAAGEGGRGDRSNYFLDLGLIFVVGFRCQLLKNAPQIPGTMHHPQNFHSHFCNAIENQIILKLLDPQLTQIIEARMFELTFLADRGHLGQAIEGFFG